MASQRINELNTLTSLDDADLILSFDSSGSESKAITRADLRTDLEPTAGDGIDLTSNTLTVDIKVDTGATATISSAAYTRLGDYSLDTASVASGTAQINAGSGYAAYYETADVTTLYIYSEVDDAWAIITETGADFSSVSDNQVVNGTGGYSSSGPFSTTTIAGLLVPSNDSRFVSAGGGALAFEAGQLKVVPAELSITESQISDFGSYATTAALFFKADTSSVSNVDNTSDADKPVSTAQQAALDLKADAADVSNVDNTADADKPISTATQTALDAKLANVVEDTTPQLGGELDAQSNKITSLAEPTANADAATKNYVDAATSGQGAFWTPVLVEADSNITLSGEQTIDGELTSTSRVLVLGQTDASENGIYVSAAGAWSRATDADDAAEFKTNKTVFVSEGAAHAGNVHAYTGSDDPTLDTDNITFTLKQAAADLADGAVSTAKLADDSVTSAKLAAGAVDATALASSINVNEFIGVTTPETEPTTYYFLVVDQSDGSIKVVDKNFLEA